MTKGTLSSDTYDTIAEKLGEDVADDLASCGFAALTQKGLGGPQDAVEELDPENQEYMDNVLEGADSESEVVEAAMDTEDPKTALKYAMANAGYSDVMSGEITLSG